MVLGLLFALLVDAAEFGQFGVERFDFGTLLVALTGPVFARLVELGSELFDGGRVVRCERGYGGFVVAVRFGELRVVSGGVLEDGIWMDSPLARVWI
jgi:hypothetical protein